MVGLVRKQTRKEERGMTPDLMEAGARSALQAYAQRQAAARPSRAAAQRGFGRVLRRRASSTSRTARILYLDDITVSFDGFKALNELSLDISAGELRCIIGPNGAGKTTMMDVITGKTRPDAGTAFFGSTIDLLRMQRDRDRADRHRPQVPEADGVRAAHACSRTWSWR